MARTFLEWLRGDGDAAAAPGADLAFGDLNRKRPDWPSSPPWVRIGQLPPPTRRPARRSSSTDGPKDRFGGFVRTIVTDALDVDWIVPGAAQRVVGPRCGAAAKGEYSATFGSSMSFGILANVPGASEAVEASVGFEINSGSATTCYMDSADVEAPDPQYAYMVVPLVEVLLIRTRVETIHLRDTWPSPVPVSYLRYDRTSERRLYTKTLSYAVLRRPCKEDSPEEVEDAPPR